MDSKRPFDSDEPDVTSSSATRREFLNVGMAAGLYGAFSEMLNPASPAASPLRLIPPVKTEVHSAKNDRSDVGFDSAMELTKTGSDGVKVKMHLTSRFVDGEHYRRTVDIHSEWYVPGAETPKAETRKTLTIDGIKGPLVNGIREDTITITKTDDKGQQLTKGPIKTRVNPALVAKINAMSLEEQIGYSERL